MADTKSQIVIVHPGNNGESYRELARRLFTALEGGSWETTLFSSRELCETTMGRPGDMILAVVDPVGCAAASGDRSEFFAKLNSADRRIAISAEAVEDARYNQQFWLPVGFDAIFDIGFVSQRDEHPVSGVPYHFVFNGPTKQEEQIIAELPLSQERSIPWAVVGRQSPEHLNLVTELVDYKLYPGGFVFLPRSPRIRKGQAPFSTSELALILSKTKHYVWGSHYSSGYYESFRFVEALLAGAVPCKIVSGHSWQEFDIPGIFPSIQSFCEKTQEEGAWSSMYCLAKEFYISKGPLAGHLERALHLA